MLHSDVERYVESKYQKIYRVSHLKIKSSCHFRWNRKCQNVVVTSQKWQFMRTIILPNFIQIDLKIKKWQPESNLVGTRYIYRVSLEECRLSISRKVNLGKFWKFGSILMSTGAIHLKYFQDGGTSGYTGSRCQLSYFKWNTLYIITFLNFA